MATDNELENGGVATTEPTSTPTEFKTRIKLKRDTEEHWNEAADKTILNGEVVLVDTADGRLRAKIGGANTKYEDLEFIDNIHVITQENKDDDIPVNAIIVIDTTEDSVGEVGGGTTGGGTVIDGSAYMPNITVTDEDNGKVLGVVNGKWAVMTIQTSGSGSGGTGEDGFSPTINVNEIDGGHEIIITDIDGEKEPIYVMDGIDGKSAYQIAYEHNFAIGTEAEWIASLKGEPGDPFVYSDFTEEQLAALKGEKGDAFTYADFTPEQLAALKGEDGNDYVLTENDKTEIAEQAANLVGGTGDGFSSVQSDYTQNDSTQPDYIKNRPFYKEGYSYEWDGTAPEETKKVGGSQFYYYKISDKVMTVSDLVGARVTTSVNVNETIAESSIKTYDNGSFTYLYYNNRWEFILVCVETASFDTALGTVELTPGLWFLYSGIYARQLEKDAGVKQIDNEFIPKATAIDDANADLPVTAGLVKTELAKKADLVEGKIPVEQLPDGIGSGSASGGTGEDGFSPTINVNEIDGGHEIIITDIDGEKEPIYVMDGIDGKSAYQIAYEHNFAIGTEAEWIASLKGEPGDPFVYSDFTEEQLAALKGEKGDAFTYSDFTPEQLEKLKGEKGDAFTYEDFTQAQLDALKPVKGTDYFDGDDYILTDADKTEIANETKGLLNETVQEMREIASGKCNADAFDTVADMTAWLSDANNTANLKLGDVFYIRAVDVPDYWWEPIKERAELSQYTDNDVVISGIGAARVLETTKVALEDYVLTKDAPTIKVNNAVNADTIDGKQIVVSNEAPDPNGEDNQNIITIVI